MTSPVLSSSANVLAYFPSPSRGVWDLGPIPLRAYAFFIIVGIIVAIFWGERRWIARGGEPGTILDVAIWAVPFGLVGGRLYHVATDWTTYFGNGGHPIDALKIWEGGLGIWGAVLLGGVGAWIGCRLRGISVAALGDAIAPPILLAQAIGRLGNYFNQELYGRETTVPWGMKVYERVNSDGVVDALNGVSTGVVEKVVHPTFLYELLWNLLIVGLLVWVDRRFRIGHGRLFALYVAGYCAGRFWVELMRDDYATHIAGVRINSFTAGIVFVLAAAYFIFARKGREEPSSLISNRGRAELAAAGGVATDVDDNAEAPVVDDSVEEVKADDVVVDAEAKDAPTEASEPVVTPTKSVTAAAVEPEADEKAAADKVEDVKTADVNAEAVVSDDKTEEKAEKAESETVAPEKVEAKKSGLVEAKPVAPEVEKAEPKKSGLVEAKKTEPEVVPEKADNAVSEPETDLSDTDQGETVESDVEEADSGAEDAETSEVESTEDVEAPAEESSVARTIGGVRSLLKRGGRK